MGNQQASLNLIPVFNSTKHFIDPLGNVYSTARGHLKTLKLMPHLARGKKLYVRVKVGDTTYLAHRYIASAMVGRVLAPTEQVNHKDGDTTNNCISNLEIVSHSENVAHAVKKTGCTAKVKIGIKREKLQRLDRKIVGPSGPKLGIPFGVKR